MQENEAEHERAVWIGGEVAKGVELWSALLLRSTKRRPLDAKPPVRPLIPTHLRISSRDTCRAEPETKTKQERSLIFTCRSSRQHALFSFVNGSILPLTLHPHSLLPSHSPLLSPAASPSFSLSQSPRMIFISQARCRWKYSTQNTAASVKICADGEALCFPSPSGFMQTSQIPAPLMTTVGIKHF